MKAIPQVTEESDWPANPPQAPEEDVCQDRKAMVACTTG